MCLPPRDSLESGGPYKPYDVAIDFASTRVLLKILRYLTFDVNKNLPLRNTEVTSPNIEVVIPSLSEGPVVALENDFSATLCLRGEWFDFASRSSFSESTSLCLRGES